MELDLAPAFRIAVEVHGAQRDKAGEPYLFHVFRVADQMDTDEERVVAILHDAIEDAGSRARGVAQAIYESYGVAIGDAVVYLTKQVSDATFGVSDTEAHSYHNYIRRLSTNPLAVKVKFADLKDNRNRDRLRKLPRAEADRLWDKYEKAWLALYAAAEESGALKGALPCPK